MDSVTKNFCYGNLNNASHGDSPAIDTVLSKPTYTVKIFPAAQIESIPQSSPGEIPTEIQKLCTWAAHVWHHGQTREMSAKTGVLAISTLGLVKKDGKRVMYSWTFHVEVNA
ncbi:hypothetical protein BGAL_0252g00190 [Botrytis galanthina]|uniref:Uncharacterized protein n=1 Tax=Botrytis galanthina TaxID=278940 RepID=A0A4S8QT26_9HELO|nr:hypothetical protein BGAL_0252g00190 [Botrytis galanthina]